MPTVAGGGSNEPVSFIPSPVAGGGSSDTVSYIPNPNAGGGSNEIVEYEPFVRGEPTVGSTVVGEAFPGPGVVSGEINVS